MFRFVTLKTQSEFVGTPVELFEYTGAADWEPAVAACSMSGRRAVRYYKREVAGLTREKPHGHSSMCVGPVLACLLLCC
ncbi:protein of unknown function [Trichlorobacter ammonificans]|uniref:Uncharacterized protein n=1 Tax=Trichlorobacter ammonificans TaxID=2916410 RepID=A0ABM9D6R0_9BACT|nr:protein of unknown function [Trichlorobacter ammonificans]